MKAARVLRFGSPNVITNDDLPQPEPAANQQSGIGSGPVERLDSSRNPILDRESAGGSSTKNAS